MKGHLKNCSPGTHKRIEAHIRKHRATGGKAESPEEGKDDAAEDLKDKPMRYTANSNVNDEAERDKAKRGGKIEKKKKTVEMEGHKARHHAGRRARASGGSAEDHPFTTANKGTQPAGRKVQRITEGRDA